MTSLQIIFLIAAAATLISGLMVVTAHNLVHAALWLIAELTPKWRVSHQQVRSDASENVCGSSNASAPLGRISKCFAHCRR